MREVSIIMPFRPEQGNSGRTVAFEWLRERYTEMFPDAEFIQGMDSGQPYSKTTAVNEGYTRSHGEILLVPDADAFCPKDVLERGLDVASGTQRLVMPWNLSWRLNRMGTKMLMRRGVIDDAIKLRTDVHGPPPATAGTLYIIRRDGFETVCGMDPRFRGWGYEDVSYRRSCDCLLGRTVYLKGECVCLWHPRPSLDHRRVWEGETEPKANKDLVRAYLRLARRPDRMRVLCDQHPLGKPPEPLPEHFGDYRYEGGGRQTLTRKRR